MSTEYISHSPQETRQYAKEIAKTLQRGDVLALVGQLGSGKTEFTRGFCEFFHCTSDVSSPSFAIINTYIGKLGQENGQISLYHFDLYRIKSMDELYGIGIDEYLYDDGICLLEWADRFEEILPQNTKFVRFEILSETEHRITSTLKQ